ncbi:uncharacterized protein KRP23_4597 [Phytophthora ramorum]|uniref:uncharacterized protein n=1 Tax=Phytophthora ramorum TaxID=164328 RepID=UPI0030B50A40|nr:hypothetical protein KRP23_4597 [Phytophthora ramorum]
MTGWKTVLDVATALGQVMLNLSLGPDMYTIHRNKGTGEMSVLPIMSMLVNCHVWMCYGILRNSIFPVAVSQGIGQLAAFVFNIIYFRWSLMQTRKDSLKLDNFITGLNLVGVVLGAIQMVLYYIYRPSGGGIAAAGTNGELPVVASPTSKSAGTMVSVQNPAYKPLSSPNAGKAV